MITVEEVKQRVSKALAALEEKRQTLSCKNTQPTGTPSEHLQTLAGTVLLSLAERGNTIEPAVFSRTYALMALLLKDANACFPAMSPYDILVNDSDILYWSRASKAQLMALVSTDMVTLADGSDNVKPEIGITSAVIDITLFCVMHGLNEQELICDTLPTSPSGSDIQNNIFHPLRHAKHLRSTSALCSIVSAQPRRAASLSQD